MRTFFYISRSRTSITLGLHFKGVLGFDGCECVLLSTFCDIAPSSQYCIALSQS